MLGHGARGGTIFRRRRAGIPAAAVAILLGQLCPVSAQVAAEPPAADPLVRGFETPPDSAKPRVWWHWMNGNITKEGIQADLEWMKRVGIGGFQNFDASLNTPQIVDKRLVYMTPEWKDAFKYATTLADQFGLEMAIAGLARLERERRSVGHSRAGDEEVRLERDARRGRQDRSPGVLPKPPVGHRAVPERCRGWDVTRREANATPNLSYADSAVVALPRAGGRGPQTDLQAEDDVERRSDRRVACSADGDLQKRVTLPMRPVGEQAWIQFEFRTDRRPSVRNSCRPAAPESTEVWQLIPERPDPAGERRRPTFRTVARDPERSRDTEHRCVSRQSRARFFRVNFVTPRRAA